ncbi:hypothetical protein NDU88_007479 [Pleurodeles waltl]|uniref:Reverse transcriptase domain-containing protein n=1 Tax=Pleurodeles waltl TaxID=8319 RepID=A0AAV7VQX6_PLEWA|nr:hypothetical protein NDU88_007479 [Pleurodeles waltl]
MGGTFAPSLACLYIDHFEKQFVLNEENPYYDQNRLCKRYIDDILLIWTGTREDVTMFVDWLNALNPFLRLTSTIGDIELSFLDILISEKDGFLKTEVIYKPTDRNNLLQFHSFHPRSLKENLPVGNFSTYDVTAQNWQTTPNTARNLLKNSRKKATRPISLEELKKELASATGISCCNHRNEPIRRTA